jgi:Tfp pilus assembly protein PilP
MSRLIIIGFIMLSTQLLAQSSSDILSEIDTDIKNPLEMRDPFKKEVRKQSILNRGGGKNFSSDTFSNLNSIGDTSLDRIRVVGVLLGKERRALAKITNENGMVASDSPTYTIKEGMVLGLNKGIVKGILPGGIVVVEEITNVYDKKEYLETVIPISNY